MKLVAGTVVDGKVSLPKGEFEEGSAVAVLAPEEGAPLRLSIEDEAALQESFEAVRRGEFSTGTDLIARLKARGR